MNSPTKNYTEASFFNEGYFHRTMILKISLILFKNNSNELLIPAIKSWKSDNHFNLRAYTSTSLKSYC